MFFQYNTTPQIEFIKELHNNIMFYLRIIYTDISLIIVYLSIIMSIGYILNQNLQLNTRHRDTKRNDIVDLQYTRQLDSFNKDRRVIYDKNDRDGTILQTLYADIIGVRVTVVFINRLPVKGVTSPTSNITDNRNSSNASFFYKQNIKGGGI